MSKHFNDVQALGNICQSGLSSVAHGSAPVVSLLNPSLFYVLYEVPDDDGNVGKYLGEPVDAHSACAVRS